MILLSFDIEEFDMPFEYGKTISFEDQIKISIEGTTVILDLLEKYQAKATFFSTAIFAINAPEIIKRILKNGHEIASHSYFHSDFKVEHLLQSKIKLEEITNTEVIGFRMPRMQPVDEKEIFKAGYIYNSSINPTYLPGRYNNLSKPRTYFKQDGVWQIPASVSPIIRFPLFWLSFHNLPLWLYKMICSVTFRKDKFLNIYFHPWEFTDLNDFNRFGFPGYVSKNSGVQMYNRLENLIVWMKKKNYHFHCTRDLIDSIKSKSI
jgi:peptidoglycan/xylan/chitin deacetylase (PgdA/CDA1 family)